MQNTNKDGIICDICKIEYTKSFTYYSFDIRKIRVDTNRPEIRSMLLERIIKSIDYCENCCEKIKDIIIANYKPTGAYCEISNMPLSGKYNLYYCVVDMITVNGKSVSIDRRNFEFSMCEGEFNKLNVAVEAKSISNWSSK